MIRHESIQLKVLTLRKDQSKNNFRDMQNQSFRIREEESLEIYQENYPDFRLTDEQAIIRSKKFRLIPKQKELQKSSINEYVNYLNMWKSVNKIISRNYGEDMCSFFKINLWIILQLIIISVASFSFIIIPLMIIIYDDSSAEQYIYQLISPDQKWLVNTPVFYGFYNQTIKNYTNIQYSLGRAYFYVNIICRVFYILFLIRKLIFNISAIYATGMEFKSSLRLSLLFGMWNYKINNQRDIEEQKMYIKHFVKKALSKDDERPIIKILKIIIINAFCYGISFVILERISWLITNDEEFIQSHSEVPLWLILRVPITVCLCVICANWLFDFIQCIETFRIESYKVYSSTLKILILNVSMLILLMYHWTKVIWCAKHNQISCSLLRDTITIHPTSLLHKCWETWLGQRIMMYILTFITIGALFTISIDIIKSFFKYIQISLVKPKFFQIFMFGNIFFLDCLFWLGFYYSPVLPLIYLLILILVYFYNVGMISISCFHRSSSVNNAKRFKTLFLLMLIISCVIAYSVLIYQSVAISPSTECGPFQNLTNNYSPSGFSFSEYFKDQNLILKIIHIGSDILFNNNGIWYAIIIIVLSLFFQYVFRAMAVNEIRNYVNNKLADVQEKKRSLLEDLKIKLISLKFDQVAYCPAPVLDNGIDTFFDQFSI